MLSSFDGTLPDMPSGENITVKDVDKSYEECKANGGKVLSEPKEMGNYGRYCVIEDPAGAVCALFEPA